MSDTTAPKRASYVGTSQQLCNALEHIASRKSTGKTDAVVCREAAACVAELEAALDSAEIEHGITDNGNLWRFWSKQATDYAAELTKARAEVARLRALMPEVIASLDAGGQDVSLVRDLRAAMQEETP